MRGPPDQRGGLFDTRPMRMIARDRGKFSPVEIGQAGASFEQCDR